MCYFLIESIIICRVHQPFAKSKIPREWSPEKVYKIILKSTILYDCKQDYCDVSHSPKIFYIQKCTDTVRCPSQLLDTSFAVFTFNKLPTFIDIFQCCHCHMNCIIRFFLNLFFQTYIFFISWNHLHS